MVFGRRPVPGKVKTRLIPALGAEGACDLHTSMLGYIIRVAASVPQVRGQLWLDGPANPGSYPDPLGLEVHTQRGADLGERMAHGFRTNFAAGCRAVLVAGADCPALGREHFEAMLAALEEVDVVLVPATDGGYVAMGLRRFEAGLFSAIPWGGPQVLERTLQRIEALDWRYRLLAALPDIDCEADLVHLAGTAFEPVFRPR